jgi:hypothetical protein
MNTLEYWLNLFIYKFLILVCFMAAISPLVLLVEFLGDGPVAFLPIAMMLILVLAGICVSEWIAHKAAWQRVFEGEGFFHALGSAFDEGRVTLSLLPGIGGLFRPGSTKGSP